MNTTELITRLRERYAEPEAPKCHICGAEMTVQRMSASRITYGCTGATYDDTGCHYAAGRSIADDHYEQSYLAVVDVSDPDVLALLDELEAKEEQRANWFQMAQKLGEDLDAAEKRIAELREWNAGLAQESCERQQRIIELEQKCENDPHIHEIIDLKERIAELEALAKSVKFDPIPMEELGNKSDGKKHPYMFGAGYNSAVVHCESVMLKAFAAAGIGVKGE